MEGGNLVLPNTANKTAHRVSYQEQGCGCEKKKHTSATLEHCNEMPS